MTEREAQRKVDEMILDLVRSVRVSRRSHPMLARAAADWELELEQRLNPPLALVAEPEVPNLATGETQPPATGTTR